MRNFLLLVPMLLVTISSFAESASACFFLHRRYCYQLCYVCPPRPTCDEPKLSSGAEEPTLPKVIANSIGMTLVVIPLGKFVMGSPNNEKDHRADEQQHEVSITRSFCIGAYEVTQKQYETVMGNNPSGFPANNGGPDFPVEQVSWDEAVKFCKKLSDLLAEKKAGRVYRLPTEAEWEYTCRAGTETATHYGNSLSSKDANFNGERPYNNAPVGPYVDKTAKVGSYQANKFGLFDMHGNVWEWCSDWYDENYYKNSPKADPPGPDQGQERVLRGGSWYNSGTTARAAFRHHVEPEVKYWDVGFRVVMMAPGKTPIIAQN